MILEQDVEKKVYWKESCLYILKNKADNPRRDSIIDWLSRAVG